MSKRSLNLDLALQECREGQSMEAILGAGEAKLLAAWGYLSALAWGYECEPPSREDAQEFLKLLEDWANS